MRCLLPLFLLPLLVSAQSNNSSANVQLSTSLIVEVTLGPDRAESSVTRTQVFTITPSPTATASSTGNNTASAGNNSTNTASGNSNSTSSSTTTTPANLPTASNINAGQSNSAPIPGATAGGGIYGPDDSYVAGAVALTRNAGLIGLAGFVAGGLVMLL